MNTAAGTMYLSPAAYLFGPSFVVSRGLPLQPSAVRHQPLPVALHARVRRGRADPCRRSDSGTDAAVKGWPRKGLRRAPPRGPREARKALNGAGHRVAHCPGAMPENDADRFLREAEECLREAERANNPLDQEAWLKLAEEWMKLSRAAKKRR